LEQLDVREINLHRYGIGKIVACFLQDYGDILQCLFDLVFETVGDAAGLGIPATMPDT